MPKSSLRDKLEGNELDLSMSDLEVVPVKELANIPKATQLDLSCNKLTKLPDAFCTLTHLIKLDLSKNSLTELPKDFGNLENIQHLDLLGNNLTTLPRSFCQLKKLKWLDLKDNPLEEGLKKNAGDCLDETQCKKCAIRILMYMTDLDSQLEKLYQDKLKKKQAADARQKELEEKEKEKKRQEKKADKERKRREREAKRAQEILAQSGDTSDEELNREKEKLKHNGGHKALKRSKASCCSPCSIIVLTLLLVLFIGIFVAIDYHCNTSTKDDLCVTYWHPSRKQLLTTWSQSKTQFITALSESKMYCLDFYHRHIEKLFVK